MSQSLVQSARAERLASEMTVGLDEICRDGARRMLAAALEAEAELYIESLADQRAPRGRTWSGTSGLAMMVWRLARTRP